MKRLIEIIRLYVNKNSLRGCCIVLKVWKFVVVLGNMNVMSKISTFGGNKH